MQTSDAHPRRVRAAPLTACLDRTTLDDAMERESKALESIPRYRQVAEQLRRDVAAGRYAPGDRLPSEGDLARAFSVSRGTLRQALGELAGDGLLQTVPGHGTFVRAGRVGAGPRTGG